MKEGLDDPELLVELAYVGDGSLRGVEAMDAGTSPLLSGDADLSNMVEADGYLVAGALTTLAELAAAEWSPGLAALGQAAGQAATPGIRNTATLGGNLLQRPRCWYFRNRELVCLKKGGDTCLAIAGDNRYHAILGAGPSFIVHPSSLATALVALGALVLVRGEAKASTAMPIEALFVGPKDDPTREHILEPGDVLTTIYLPKLDGSRSAYQAVREKQSHDWPLAEAAVRLRLDDDRTMRGVRVALGHVAPVPWYSAEAAAVLEGQKPDADLFARAAEAALAPATPLGGNGYKVPLTKGLLREVLHRASGLPLPE